VLNSEIRGVGRVVSALLVGMAKVVDSQWMHTRLRMDLQRDEKPRAELRLEVTPTALRLLGRSLASVGLYQRVARVAVRATFFGHCLCAAPIGQMGRSARSIRTPSARGQVR